MKTKSILLAFLLSMFFSSTHAFTNYVLDLRVLFEGYYDCNTSVMNTPLYNCGPVNCNSDYSDYVMVYLYDDNCNEVQREIGIVDYRGRVRVHLGSILSLSNITLGNYYWIRVTHRNHIEVWSAAQVQINASTSYDFTTSASQAYGNNQKDLGCGVYGMYAGDLNHDCSVDISDWVIVDPAITSGSGGYLVEDVNGDCAVDITDGNIILDNINAGAGCIQPCTPIQAFRSAVKTAPNEINLGLIIQPNPASSEVKVRVNRDKCNLTITNAIGEIVYTERMDFETVVRTSNFPKGVYNITIEHEGKTSTKKMITIE